MFKKSVLVVLVLVMVGSFAVLSQKEGGTLVIHSSMTFKDLDPTISNSAYDFYVINQVFDELITLDPDTLEPRPYVAKSWEVSEDGCEITFFLHEGIKFHNGEELKADDVEFSFEWIIDPENASPNATEYVWLKDVVVIDDYTAKFVQKEEFCPFAPALIGETQAIIPKDTYLEMGKEAFNANPIGSGPFKFVEWKRGEHITLVRNEEYWMTGRKLCYANGYDPGNEIVCEKPYLEKIIFRPIPTLATAMLELEKGGIDIADNIPAEDIPRFKEMPEVTVQQRPSLSYFYVGFNMSLSPYNDIRFRKAVYQSFSMDDAVFSIFKGLTGIRAYGAVPPALWANDREYLKEEIALPVNDEEAARLFAKLREEGVIPKGFTTTVYCPPDPRRIKLAEIIATNLIEHGIPADVQSLEWGAYLDLLYRTEEKPEGEYGIYIIGWLGAPDPDAFLYYLFTSENAMVGAGNNFSFYMNPTVDALIKQARTTLDMEVRETAYVQAQRIIFADYVHIPAYHYIDTRGVRARVKGFEVGGPVLMRIVDPFYNVWVED